MPGRLYLLRNVVTFGGHSTPQLAARRNIAPGEAVWALTAEGFVEMRWGLIPSGRTNARGRPVMDTIVNARGESVFDKSAFAGVRRAVVPIDGWYEWTGPKGRKTIWEISARAGTLLWVAAIWDIWTAPGGRGIAQLATVTCAPNAAVKDIHDRMGVLLDPEAVPIWLSGTEAEARHLLQPAPSDWLTMRQVDQAVLDGEV